jgi:hypothetical protein
VTEQEWTNCTDPLAMLTRLRDGGRMSDRKYELFAAACLRGIWHRLSASERQAVEAFESYAAGLTQEEDWDWEIVQHLFDFGLNIRVWPQGWGVELTALWDEETSEVAATLSATGMLGSWEYLSGSEGFPGVEELTQRYEARAATAGSSAWSAWVHQRRMHCALLRDLFANPFRPLPSIPPSVLQWNNGRVRRLAEDAYERSVMPAGTLDPARLAVLADALLDAGCTDPEILGHLRDPGPHWRGCHILDLLLGKS